MTTFSYISGNIPTSRPDDQKERRRCSAFRLRVTFFGEMNIWNETNVTFYLSVNKDFHHGMHERERRGDRGEIDC